ncbi:endonuclease [Flavobacterium luminosum]|uniref:Endonuclease n=1 Tax=Flavobacterium luminosum TaxID=2949086 RepID=A0ABT0TMG1_9FLAO|nr:endonuclease [Flavobacterium sp. HXWNR70]MCL9808673.1 endonuclease [Flavobacterium sp. HXWNR70]
MKKNYFLIVLLSSFLGIAQIPTGYYDSANGLSGWALKTQLKKIINSNNDGLSPEYFHVDKGYGTGTNTTNNGLWSAYGTTDRDMGIGYEDDNTIVDIYTENPNGPDTYNFNFNTASGGNNGQCGSYVNEGDCYNREHLIPQSYFGHNNSGPQLSKYLIMKTDIQHVYPTDGKVNGMRADFPFGKVGNTASYTSSNGSKLGNASNSGYAIGYSGTVFEPIDKFKGDIARVFLYFATRYEDDMDELYSLYTTVDARVMFDGSTNKVFSPTFINILLTWHLQDPVSLKEIKRNDAAFNYQSNRNPFIDHPEYVCQIWSTECTKLSNDNFALKEKTSIYPNPSNGNFTIDFKEYGDYSIEIFNTLGQKVFSAKENNKNNIEINNVQKGIYFVRISKNTQSIVEKIVIN